MTKTMIKKSLRAYISVNDITDPAEIKAYLESQGQEYNENITAIHQITFIDGEATPEGSLCEVEKWIVLKLKQFTIDFHAI